MLCTAYRLSEFSDSVAYQGSPDTNSREMLRNSHEFEPCGQYHVIQHVLRITNMADEVGKAGTWSSSSPDLAGDVYASFRSQKFHPFVSTSMMRIGSLPPATSTRTRPQSAWKPGIEFAVSFTLEWCMNCNCKLFGSEPSY